MPQGVVRGGPVWGVAHAHRYARIREASCAVLGAVRGAGGVGLGGEGGRRDGAAGRRGVVAHAVESGARGVAGWGWRCGCLRC